MTHAWSAAACFAAAGSIAAAQRTHLYTEAKSESLPVWSSSIFAGVGETVTVRIRAVYESQGSTMTNLGFGGVTHQPMLTGWSATDTVLPISPNPPPGESTLGRVYPFSTSGQTSASDTGELTTFVDSPGTLRFAGSRNLTPTTNLSWGVRSGQSLWTLNPTGYNSNLDAVIFRYAFVAGEGGRTLQASTPLDAIDGGRALWYPCHSCTAIILAPVTSDTIHAATITIVPGAWTLACLGAVLWRPVRGGCDARATRPSADCALARRA